MEHQRPHVFVQDPDAHRVVCVCHKAMLDPIHTPEIRRLVRGTATPTKFG